MNSYFRICGVALLISTLIISFGENIDVLAQEKTERRRVYRTRRRNAETTRMPPRKTGGLRGGRCNFLENVVVLPVPEDHIGNTVLARPNVLWFIKQKITQPVRITFNAFGEKPILVKNFGDLPQGFITFKIPEDNPGLEIGKLYKWTVTVVCNEKDPSKNLYAQALIERISKPYSQNSQKQEDLDCDFDFASRGIWYEAIFCSYSQWNNFEEYHSLYVEDFNSLLEQINLSELTVDSSELAENKK